MGDQHMKHVWNHGHHLINKARLRPSLASPSHFHSTIISTLTNVVVAVVLAVLEVGMVDKQAEQQ